MDRNKAFLLLSFLNANAKKVITKGNTFILHEIKKTTDEITTHVTKVLKIGIAEFWYDVDIKKGHLTII